jgi:AcrR family transcriptional regulator
MGVSVQDTDVVAAPRGARARTRRLMLDTAIGLMQRGETPSVSDVAEAAEVSRATAYRYFPSQADLVHAVVDEALGPILNWKSTATDAEDRVADLLSMSMPRILAFEATFKAALKLSLEQWARGQAGTLGREPPFKRGHRVDLLQAAIAPLRTSLPRKQFQRLAKALSLVYGLEVLIILKDLWGLEAGEVQEVAQWTAKALIRAAVEESTRAGSRMGTTGSGRSRRGSRTGISA